MEPWKVCAHIEESFCGVEVIHNDRLRTGDYEFHISVDGCTQFRSFRSYENGEFQKAIEDIAAVLIKMGLERDKPCLPRKEPDGHPVTLADSANILKQLYPKDEDMLASYAPKLERFARLCKKREVTDSNKEEPTSDDGPTLDEEFPVQPNGFRFL